MPVHMSALALAFFVSFLGPTASAASVPIHRLPGVASGEPVLLAFAQPHVSHRLSEGSPEAPGGFLRLIGDVWPIASTTLEAGQSLWRGAMSGRYEKVGGMKLSSRQEPDLQVNPSVDRIEESRQIPSLDRVFVVVAEMLLNCVLTTVIAFIYIEYRRPKTFVVQQYTDDDFRQWRYGIFDCLNAGDIPVFACICPWVRWAETMNYVPGMLRFWDAFFFALVLSTICSVVISPLLMGPIWIIAAVYIVFALLGAFFRQRLRNTFNFRSDTGDNFIFDFLLYFCCLGCCAITQEARQVEEAIQFSRCLERKTEFVGESIAAPLPRRFEPQPVQAAATQPRYVRPSVVLDNRTPYQAPPNIPDRQQHQGPPSVTVEPGLATPASVSVHSVGVEQAYGPSTSYGFAPRTSLSVSNTNSYLAPTGPAASRSSVVSVPPSQVRSLSMSAAPPGRM